MKTSLVPAGFGLLALAAGCDTSEPLTLPNEAAPIANAEVGASKRLDVALCAPSRGGFTVASTNPWFPMDVGRQLVLETEENGETVTNQVTVLDRTQSSTAWSSASSRSGSSWAAS